MHQNPSTKHDSSPHRNTHSSTITSTNADLNQTYRPLTIKFPRVRKPSRQNTTLGNHRYSTNATSPQHAARYLDHYPDFPTVVDNFPTVHSGKAKLKTATSQRGQSQSCIKNVSGSPDQKLQTATNKGQK